MTRIVDAIAVITTSQGATVILEVPSICTQGPRCGVGLNETTKGITTKESREAFGGKPCDECDAWMHFAAARSKKRAKELFERWKNPT